MILKAWEDLPEELRLAEVKPYYDVLAKRKGSLFAKRVFDFVAALIILLLLLPLFLVLAIAIKLDSAGSVFFRQVRITQYGREFRIFKFRTMVADAEKLGTQVTVDKDSRITKVGTWLRGCRLDETPQLFNIITGDMSFVGTRPEVKKYVSEYTPEMMATLLLPAGVTSLASIKFKDEAELMSEAKDVDKEYVERVLPRKMKYNLQALKDFGFGRDLGVIWKTVFIVGGKNLRQRNRA